MLTPWKGRYDQPRQYTKKQRYYFANKSPSSQGYGFSSGYVWMWELNYKESWAPRNWCFWTLVLEKTLESPLDCREIQPVNYKGNQSRIFIGRTDAEADTPIFWPPDVKNWLIGKYPDAGKDWRREEKGMTEDEMVGWHPRLKRHEFEQALGVGDGQGSLACCSPWGCKESDTTELNWTEATQMVSAGPRCLFLEGGWSTLPGVYCSSVATWADGCAVSLMEISVLVINRFLEQWWGRRSFTVQSHNSCLARMWHAAKLFYLYCLLGAPSVMEEAGKWRVGWKGRLH